MTARELGFAILGTLAGVAAVLTALALGLWP